MLAARQATGFPSATSSDFCTSCGLSIQNIHVLDRKDWPSRDWSVLKKHAEQWELAATEYERQEIWNEFKIRYSPFNKLPYHNPITSTVPDAMHFELLNIIPHFLRNILGINHTVEGGDGSHVDLLMKRPSLDILQSGVEKLHACSTLLAFKAVAATLPTSVLRTICFDNRLQFAGKKASLVDNLCALVSSVSHHCAMLLTHSHMQYKTCEGTDLLHLNVVSVYDFDETVQLAIESEHLDDDGMFLISPLDSPAEC